MTSSWQACPQGEEPSGQILLQIHESLSNVPGNNPSPVRCSRGHILPVKGQVRLEGPVEFCISTGISLSSNTTDFWGWSLASQSVPGRRRSSDPRAPEDICRSWLEMLSTALQQDPDPAAGPWPCSLPLHDCSLRKKVTPGCHHWHNRWAEPIRFNDPFHWHLGQRGLAENSNWGFRKNHKSSRF